MSPDRSLINLRLASLDDARFVFDCRNDPDARVNSFNSDVIEWDDHQVWFGRVLSDSDHRIYIAECNGDKVGVARGDKVPSGWVLSWSVVSDARGKGVGRALVTGLVGLLDGRLEAWVREDNIASMKIAKSCGLVETGETKQGFVAFEKVKP